MRTLPSGKSRPRKSTYVDSGLLHALLNIGTERELLAHPKCGASWEGYVLEEVVKLAGVKDVYFWATHQGAELDVLFFSGDRRIGVEVKHADAPTLTPSMRIALEDLQLDALTVIYPGRRSYDLGPKVRVIPLTRVAIEGVRALMPPRRSSA